jgi:hypothetical protein
MVLVHVVAVAPVVQVGMQAGTAGILRASYCVLAYWIIGKTISSSGSGRFCELLTSFDLKCRSLLQNIHA